MLGIREGMVMQRGADDTCAVWLESESPVEAVRYEGAADGAAAVEAAGGRYRVTGIPAGGPYTVWIGETAYRDIYVGDVWLLAGQSNMEGVGWLTPEDQAFAGNKRVRALYMDDAWRPARHPLHQTWTAVDAIHAQLLNGWRPDPIFRGVGPGLAFAQRMEELEGVPQGVLCCAHGGTSMAQWSPALGHLGGDKSLYGAMQRRFRANGAHVRGLFWHQGCSETGDSSHYQEDMLDFVRHLREDFGADLPIVVGQIGRIAFETPDGAGVVPAGWNRVRDVQRRLPELTDRLLTVSTIHLPLEDLIHLSRSAQNQLGREAAESMAYLLHGADERGCMPPPAFRDLRIFPQEYTGTAVVELHYGHLHGGLTAAGRPNGFTIVCDPDKPEAASHIFDVRLHENTVRLYTAYTPERLKGCWLYYGYGCTPYCNITDMAGRSLPAMGPIALA